MKATRRDRMANGAGDGERASASEHRGHQPGLHKVLLVDDETGIRKGCQRVLEAEGHQVVSAETGERALELLREHEEIDVALVDLRLPTLDGLEVLSRAREVAPETVCVVMTAYATLETAIEATKRGAYDFLTKPFTPDDLVRVVNKSLERAHLLRERNRLQTERKQRLLELATEQTRLRTIINAMADGVIVCNADEELVLYNPAALRVLPGLSPEQGVSELENVVQPAELLELMDEASEAHTRLSREIELSHLPICGWILAEVAPVVDERSGSFLGTVAVLRDITELKRVEELKAQFVNMVAHELRSPLAAVSGYLSVMMDGMVTDPAKQQDMLDRCNQRISALLDLVSDLLDVSRMEGGTIRREIDNQLVGQLLDDVTTLMEPLAQEKGVTISVDLPEALLTVQADREELIRLFNNLISNAIKYNREGGHVSVVAEEDGHYVKVYVKDTGVGISEEGLKRLFSEFFREKRPETAYVTGTGLGLTIVKRIVDFYHGRIDVQSSLGEGSTFTVWLPRRFDATQCEWSPREVAVGTN